MCNDAMTQYRSEIVCIREEIDLHLQAMRCVFSSLTIVSRHTIINHLYGQIGDCVERLEQLISHDESISNVVERINSYVDQQLTIIKNKGYKPEEEQLI